MGVARIEQRFAALKAEGRAGLVTFTMAGDPDLQTAQELLDGLPEAGADLVELGMPFTDPMADGPAIQLAGQRALKAGTTLNDVLEMVRRFRTKHAETPLVLMGYFNPIYHYGVDQFLSDAVSAGVDGLIVVDLPPEEDQELCLPARDQGLAFIRLATPTTDAKRLPQVLAQTSGFLYYVSITGITGAKAPDPVALKPQIALIREHSDLPVAIGFGIKTPEQAQALGQIGDAVVVGSAIVSKIAEAFGEGGPSEGAPKRGGTDEILAFVRSLSAGLRGG